MGLAKGICSSSVTSCWIICRGSLIFKALAVPYICTHSFYYNLVCNHLMCGFCTKILGSKYVPKDTNPPVVLKSSKSSPLNSGGGIGDQQQGGALAHFSELPTSISSCFHSPEGDKKRKSKKKGKRKLKGLAIEVSSN